MTQTINKLVEFSNDFKAAKKKFHTEAQDAFRAACQELFEEFPDLESFSWAQYSPYFNDGNPCVFRVRDLSTIVYQGKEFRGDDCTVSSSRWDCEAKKQVPCEPYVGWYAWRGDPIKYPDGFDLQQAIKAFNTVIEIHNFVFNNQELAEEAFGDDGLITVSRNGIEVTEYDHG